MTVLGSAKQSKLMAISIAPSLNYTNSKRTSVGAFTLTQTLDNSGSTASQTNFNGQPAYLLSQTAQPTCTGDEPGWAGGVKSGTVGKEVKPTSASATILVEGKQLVREGDTCTMNNGNTTGKYIINGFSPISDATAAVFYTATATSRNVQTVAEVVKSVVVSRAPTKGEIQMLKDTFGEEAFTPWQLNDFQIHKASLINDRSVVINGEIYFDDNYYVDDFSEKQSGYSLDYEPERGALFIHESTHVWQYNLGHSNLANGLYLQGGYELYEATDYELGYDPYDYEIPVGAKFDDFNMEQQGDIMADYYLLSLRHPNHNFSGFSNSHVVENYFQLGYTYEQIKQIYSNVLKDFIKEPNDRGNLPNWF